VSGCRAEPSLATAEAEERFQFEREGYFFASTATDSTPWPPGVQCTVDTQRDSLGPIMTLFESTNTAEQDQAPLGRWKDNPRAPVCLCGWTVYDYCISVMRGSIGGLLIVGRHVVALSRLQI